MNPGGRHKRILPLVVAGGIVILGVAGLVLMRPARPVPVQSVAVVPQVLRSELQLREGRLYRVTETNAFTGWMLERYKSGTLRSRSAISNGMMQGLSEGWHTNGQPQIREHFQAGISHGQRIKYYPDGSKLSEVTVVEGKLEGTFRRWHPNGQLAERVELRAGTPDGDSKSYFPSRGMTARFDPTATAEIE